MPVIYFMQRFAEAVERGAKRQTIRRKRVTPIQPGDELILTTGARSREYRELKRVTCRSVESIRLFCSFLRIDGKRYEANSRVALSLAIQDGFRDYADMMDFFEELYSLPFDGVLIKW